jgi:hypothetical protein
MGCVLTGTSGPDILDAYWCGQSDDTIYGLGGNDILAGYDGYDKLYGGSGNDTLWGEGSFDDLYGGTGVDQLWGDAPYLGVEGNDPNGDDYFYFNTKDSGDIFAGKADTINDFETQDQIFLKGSYDKDYSGTWAPADGDVSIWQKGSDWVVTWNSSSDTGYHDVLVKGDQPTLDDISFY